MIAPVQVRTYSIINVTIILPSNYHPSAWNKHLKLVFEIRFSHISLRHIVHVLQLLQGAYPSIKQHQVLSSHCLGSYTIGGQNSGKKTVQLSKLRFL